METMTSERLSEAQAAAEVGALRTRRNPSSARLARMAEAARIFERACTGNRRALADLEEALSTSDFSYIFGDVLDRELMAQYQQLDPVWPQFATRSTVNDFRPKHYVDLMGGRGLLEKVDQLAPYPQRKPSDAQYLLQVAKYGGRFSLSWEDMINDDLQALRDLPQRLAEGARNTEDYLATGVIASAAGPNSTLFGASVLNTVSPSSGGSNLLSGNPALSTDALSSAITAVSNRRDVDNRPVIINGFVLMVPPSLEVTAHNIVNAIQVRIGNTNTGNGEQMLVGNWLANRVSVVVNPWLPVIDQSANAATTWYLLPRPTTGRPAAVLGFLRGHETPDLRYKAEGGQSVGGGQVPATEGSFDVDDIAYRVRHVLGTTSLDPIATAVSNGSGV